mgnify:CR=1 FL=1
MVLERFIETIDLSKSVDRLDEVFRAVACLARGGVVVLPTETGYAAAASVLVPAALDRLRRLAGLSETAPLPVALRTAEELEDWIASDSRVGRRLARRAWPGPLTLTWEPGAWTGERLPQALPPDQQARLRGGDGRWTFRSPGHPVPRDLIRWTSGPVALACLEPGRARQLLERSCATETATSTSSPPETDWILDDGPRFGPQRATEVTVSATGWRITQPGTFSLEQLQRMAGIFVLFVCTGNTCRSPMAQALCRKLLAERLGCPPEELPQRGFVIASAGLAANWQQPASEHAIDAMKRRNAHLEDHLSQPISLELVRQADWILTMTGAHANALIDHLPELEPKVTLLDPQGHDVADPFGGDAHDYERAAADIESFVRQRLDDLLALHHNDDHPLPSE